MDRHYRCRSAVDGIHHKQQSVSLGLSGRANSVRDAGDNGINKRGIGKRVSYSRWQNDDTRRFIALRNGYDHFSFCGTHYHHHAPTKISKTSKNGIRRLPARRAPLHMTAWRRYSGGHCRERQRRSSR